MNDREKAFEYDRAKTMLEKTGREGGLVYEVLKLLRLAPSVTPRSSSRAGGRPGVRRESQSSSSASPLN